MNNRKENEQSCIVMNKKEGTSCIKIGRAHV